MVFNLFKSKTVKPFGSHGSHWEIALGNAASIKEIVLSAVSSPKTSENFKDNSLNIFMGKKPINKFLDALSMTVNGNIYTAYPANNEFVKMFVLITNVTEWQNGYEAWVECKLENAVLNFFPIDYYKNKKQYVKGNKLSIGFSALGYSAKKAIEQTCEDATGKKISTKGMCALLPANWNHPTLFPDDYLFQGTILDLKKDKGCFFLKTKLLVFEKQNFEAWIYFFDKHLAESIKKSDNISGMLWLQGKIV